MKPSTGTGKLLRHTLGAKTIDLIHRHVHVEACAMTWHVRFDGWQTTRAGRAGGEEGAPETLFKYRLHQDQELFDRAYGYIRQYC